jgi:thiol-disulfide isomerase/thioredoxin
MKRWGLGLLVALLALACGVALRHFTERDQDLALRELRQLALTSPEGTAQSLMQWPGKVLVINFWATWCEPCLKEIPALMRVQRKTSANGVQIVGIGIDDAAKIRQFSKTLGIDYPIVVAGLRAVDVTRRLGNPAGGLPFTVVLDRQGRMVASHLGALSEEQLEAILRPLLST